MLVMSEYEPIFGSKQNGGKNVSRLSCHTEYSDDSTYPMESVVTDAIELGLDEICFTDLLTRGTLLVPLFSLAIIFLL